MGVFQCYVSLPVPIHHEMATNLHKKNQAFKLLYLLFFFVCRDHYNTNPKQLVKGKSLKITIDLHCLIPPIGVIYSNDPCFVGDDEGQKPNCHDTVGLAPQRNEDRRWHDFNERTCNSSNDTRPSGTTVILLMAEIWRTIWDGAETLKIMG